MRQWHDCPLALLEALGAGSKGASYAPLCPLKMVVVAAVGGGSRNIVCVDPLDQTVLHTLGPNETPRGGLAAVGHDWLVTTQRKEAAIYLWRWGQKTPHAKVSPPRHIDKSETPHAYLAPATTPQSVACRSRWARSWCRRTGPMCSLAGCPGSSTRGRPGVGSSCVRGMPTTRFGWEGLPCAAVGWMDGRRVRFHHTLALAAAPPTRS